MKRNSSDGSQMLVLADEDSCIWVERFNDTGLREFYKKFMKLEADNTVPVIPIVVSSYGGYAYILLAMRDIIKSSTKPVATIALSKAMSCGASLLAAGTPGLRFASPDTHILIHEISSGHFGKTHDLKVETRYTVELNKLFLRNLANDVGCTVQELQGQIDKLKNSDWMMTAKEAQEWGFVDHIGVPRILEQPAMKILMGGRPFTKEDFTKVLPKKRKKVKKAKKAKRS